MPNTPTCDSSAPKALPARLVLEDGSVYHGDSIGVPGTTLGELVFNTSSTGYQEILTDPSYRGQLVLMTYPEIGNYGISSQDFESAHINAVGLVVSRLSPFTSSWRSEFSLQEFLVKNKVVGIEGVDTRAITRKIREQGTLKAGITTEAIPDADFIRQVQAQPGFDELDMISQVTTIEPYTIRTENPVSHIRVQKLVVVDYGIKASILHYLQQYVEEIVVLPAHCDFEQIVALQPQGVLLSNGPGDPAVLHEAVRMARQLMDSGMPTFGICLGHQILGLACGAKVSKMRFGHHGGNHPVKDMLLDKVFITSQNHGYCVEFDQFPEDRLMVTHINLNDQTIEGFQHRNAPVMSVQFHPEASPGPHDANYIFERFMRTAVESSLAAV